MSVPGRKAGELSAPRNVESEESSEMFCQPCGDNAQQLPATGFCVDCCEYLCNSCFTLHRRARPFKHHVLQDQKTMPRNKPQTKTLDATVDKCPRHQGEVITFNCRLHDELVCATCIAINHRSCDSISYVETEYEDLEKKLADLGQQVDSNTRTTEQNATEIDKYFSEAIESIGHFRADITHVLDKFEHDVINKANKIRDEDREEIISISTKLDNMRSEIQSKTSHLDTLHKNKQNGKLFPAMDKTKLEMQTLGDGLTQIQKDNKIKRFQFEPDKQIQYLITNLTTLGNLSLMNEPIDTEITQMKEQKENRTTQTEIFNDNKATQTEIPNISKASQTEILHDSKMTQTENPDDRKTTETEIPVPTTAPHETDIYVKSAYDWSNCKITGSVLLPDNQLVITDFTNSKVKLVDTKQNRIMTEIQLPHLPRGITKVANTKVAVTQGSNILFLSVVSHTLSKGQEIKVNGSCYGIVHNDGTLIVALVDPAKVEIINMTGTVLKSLMCGAINKQLFVKPHYIAISPDKTVLYVSDMSKHTVTCMAMDGTVKAVYKDDKLKDPRGLAIDRTGTVYVCGFGSYNIHQITTECNKIQILLGQEHGLSRPHSITYCDREDKLYVGMYNNNVVEVFQLK